MSETQTRAAASDSDSRKLAANDTEPRKRAANDSAPRDILNIEEAAELLGVSIKTFNKVLHSQDLPARKIGREWKFSRRALIDWVGSGTSSDFYRESSDGHDERAQSSAPATDGAIASARARRTAGWRIEFD
jgi:excisionase family DNA binding protein